MEKNHGEIIKKIEEKLKKKKDVISIGLVGSLLTIKYYDKKVSDIDLIVITREKIWKRKIYLEKDYNITIDISYYCFEQLYYETVIHRKMVFINMFQNIKILYDKYGLLHFLKENVKEFIKNYKNSIIYSNDMMLMLKNYYAHNIKGVKCLSSEKSELIVNVLFTQVINDFFNIKRAIKPKEKYILDAILEIDKIFYQKLLKFLKSKTIESKIDCLTNLIKYLFKDFGEFNEYIETNKMPYKA